MVIDFTSSTWQLLKARMLAAEQNALEQLTLERDPIIAAELRGRIAALAAFIELDRPVEPKPEPPKERPASDSSGYVD